ncbi:PRTRC system protein C [Hydrogenophaga sp. BPS33]|uniref:PRTRC system protein C n=1 Tax=Hydrogenophaga sp. BPS33 TaxID=2651974 RepID=UPI00191731E6|nr:PRTRC system protein C [Hydrogenophaga sp. BPS33]
MQVINLTRKYRYNSLTLPDPNEAMTPDQVREFYATQFPELNNAVIEGPVTENGVATWSFIRAAGAKGREEVTASPALEARALIEKALCTSGAGNSAALPQARLDGTDAVARRLSAVLTASQRRGKAISMPSSAFGIWG